MGSLPFVRFEPPYSKGIKTRFLTFWLHLPTQKSTCVKAQFLLPLSHLSSDNTSPTIPGGHQNMMWVPIKWFVYQGSWRPLPALYKNSPPNPGAGYSWDRGHSQFSFFLCCLHSLLSAQSHQVAQTSFSHDTHSSMPWGCSHRVSEQSKVGDKNACVYVRTRGHTHLRGCMHTPNRQHLVMVLLPLTSPLKRCFCPLSLILFHMSSKQCLYFQQSRLQLN